MGSKKRISISSSSEDESEKEQVETPTDKITSKPSKKLKMAIPVEEAETEDENNRPNAVLPGSDKPMERRKKTKALDKEKHRNSSTIVDKPKPKMAKDAVQAAPLASCSSSSSSVGLPEFHIGVFKDLGSADLSIREAAALKLVMELQGVQQAYEKCDKKEVEEGGLKLEAEKDDGLKNCAPSLRYAIRRLIRGVSSSRECARQGFALGLSVLVGAIPCIKLDSLMKLIIDLLEVTSSMKGQERRDCFLGRLFAYGALARSSRIAEEWMSDRSTHLVKEFTSDIISLAIKKRYLQEPAVSVILNLIEKLPVEALSSQVLEAPGMHDWFEKAVDVGNPDALLLALKIREKIPGDTEMFRKLLPYPFSPNKMFTSDHISSLVSCFKESTFCQPRVHSIWPVLINILLTDGTKQDDDADVGSVSTKKHKKSRKYSSSEEEIAKNLQCFFEVVIEGSLLPSSHDRKHLAFDVVLLLLPKLPPSCVQIVLSHKLIHCLMDILSTKDSWLYKAAQYFLKELSNWVGKDDDRRVAVIVALQKHSSGKFDCLTHTRIVKDLMGEFNTGSGCMLFVQNLVSMFVEEGDEAEEPSDQSQTMDDNSEIGSVEEKDSAATSGSPDFLKSWVIDSLHRVLKYPKLDSEAKLMVQKEIMKFLAIQGLFSASLGTEVTSFELQEKFKWPKIATSSALRQMCVEQLQLLLATAQKGEGIHSLPVGPDLNDLGAYFMRFLSTLCNIPSVSLFRTLSSEDEQAFKKLQAMETRLSREERNAAAGENANKLHSMRYLLIQLMLQVFLRPGEFSESAAELVICCKKIFSSSDLLDNSGDDDDAMDNDDDDAVPEVMDVLVDTLLALLPQSSVPLNSAIEQVFKFFSNEVTNTGLLQMLRVIKKDIKPPRNQASDSEDDDDDEDLLGLEEAEETDEADAIESDDNSDKEEDDSEITTGVNTIDNAQVVPEASDESDGGMDDDAMFRMDSYLAKIFRERKNQAGGQTAQSQLVLFKLRVLALLEVYLQENPGKPEVLTVYSFLAKAFVNPQTAESSEQLSERIWGILQKKIFKAKEYPKGDIQLETLESLLEKSLKLASKPSGKRKLSLPAENSSKKKNSSRLEKIASLAQTSTHWILKILHSKNYPETNLKGVVNVFEEILGNYFDNKKSQLKPGFVKEILRRQPWLGILLFKFLVEKCTNAKSEVRLVKSLDVVEEILKFSGKGDGDGEKAARKFLKSNLKGISELIGKLVMNLPENKGRRAQVRRFCGQVLRLVVKLKMSKEFLKVLSKEVYDACEAKLGDIFVPFKKLE